MRLTAAQRDLLSRIANGWILTCRRSENYWWLFRKKHRWLIPHHATIRACEQRGYIAILFRTGDLEDWTVTASGRAALAQSVEKIPLATVQGL